MFSSVDRVPKTRNTAAIPRLYREFIHEEPSKRLVKPYQLPPIERTTIGGGNFERPIAIYISVYTLVHFSRKHVVIDLVDISLPYLAAFKIHSAVAIQLVSVQPIRRV